jgi:hypothetical protein
MQADDTPSKKGAKGILLVEVNMESGGKQGLHDRWRQIFPASGEMTSPTVMDVGREKVVCLSIKEAPILMKCLGCTTLFVLGGCARCGNTRLRIVAKAVGETTPILEVGLVCGRCGHVTDSTWPCKRCATRNPNHLTLGMAAPGR